MSGVAVVRYLQANDAGVIAVVPAARIFAGVIPEGTAGTALPALGTSTIDSVERRTVSMAGTTKLRTERVQTDILAATYAQKKSLVELVRAACANRHGTVNGIDVDSILPAGEGPDDDDPAAVIYSCSIDFLVRWRSS